MVKESGKIIMYKKLYINFFIPLGFIYFMFNILFNTISKKLKIWLWNITIEITARYDIIIPILNTENGLYIHISINDKNIFKYVFNFISLRLKIFVITSKRLALSIESSNEQKIQNAHDITRVKITESDLFNFLEIYEITIISVAILAPDTASK